MLSLEELPAKMVSFSRGQAIFLAPLRKLITVYLTPLPWCFNILFQRISGWYNISEKIYEMKEVMNKSNICR
jgi:hypothetical protein